uniref:Uncharacterized protein n=1 Tax=Gadus morhua TaxID=8049 RepID=A0A8C5CMN0_GADMO
VDCFINASGCCSPTGWTVAPRPRDAAGGRASPTAAGGRPFPWVVTLASVLIFTIVVDIIGNLLVVISVLRNRKLRKAGRAFCIHVVT